MRIKLSVMHRGGGSSPSRGNLEADLIKIRKQFDMMREQTKIKDQLLENFKDGVRDLELQSKRPNQEDSPVTRNIRMLENRLDKALIKFNEAQVFSLFNIRCAYAYLFRSLLRKPMNRLSNV